MEDDAYTYLVWHPRIHVDGSLVLNVTPGERSFVPSKREFFQELLRDLKVSSDVESWDVLAYRSSYQGEPGAESWEDRWPINWRVTLKLTKPLTNPPLFKDEYLGTFAVIAESLNEESRPAYACFVISDYEKAGDADSARKALLASEEITTQRQNLSAPELEFERVTLDESLIQDQINLGSFDKAFFTSGAAYAVAVERVCQANGGITNFDKRANERDELYNPDGIG
jgi:hypothetical protein